MRKKVPIKYAYMQFKILQKSLESKGEMNKQCCQNDMTLASTVIKIKQDYYKSIRKLTHKENNEKTSIKSYLNIRHFLMSTFHG